MIPVNSRIFFMLFPCLFHVYIWKVIFLCFHFIVTSIPCQQFKPVNPGMFSSYSTIAIPFSIFIQSFHSQIVQCMGF